MDELAHGKAHVGIAVAVFVSGSSGLFKQMKSRHRFEVAGGVLVKRVGAVSVRPVGRGASMRKGTLASTDPRVKAGDRGPGLKRRSIRLPTETFGYGASTLSPRGAVTIRHCL